MGLADRDYYGKKFWELLEGKEEIFRQKKIRKPQKDSSFEEYGGEIDLKPLIGNFGNQVFKLGKSSFQNIFKILSVIFQIIFISFFSVYIGILLGWLLPKILDLLAKIAELIPIPFRSI